MDGPSRSRATRRGFFGLLGAVALAGCSGTSGERGVGDRTLTAAPLPDSTSTPRDRRVIGPDLAGDQAYAEPWYDRTATTTLSPTGLTVAFHPLPSGLPGLVGGGQFGRRGTEEAPARLLLTLVNTGDQAVSLHHDTVPGRLATPQGDARAYLLPDPSEDNRDVPTGLWFDGDWRGRPSGHSAGTTTIGPDEFGTFEYVLVAGPEGPPFPVGTYEFETGFGWRFTIGLWRTDAPGPDGPSRFASADVPGLPSGAPLAWFHRADRTTEVYLRPSREQVSLASDGTTLRVALFNNSSTTLVGNPFAYELLKLHEGSWYPLVLEQPGTPERYLPSGATEETRFVLYQGFPEAGGWFWEEGRDEAITVGHLGGGRYAVRFGMHRPGERRQYATLLGVDAPPVTLSHDPGLRVDGRDSSDPVGWLDPGAQLFDAVITVTRTDEPADRTVIAEQVMGDRVLRNTIPLFETDTETVELHTQNRIADRLIRPKATLRFSFRGTTYEVTRQDD